MINRSFKIIMFGLLIGPISIVNCANTSIVNNTSNITITKFVNKKLYKAFKLSFNYMKPILNCIFELTKKYYIGECFLIIPLILIFIVKPIYYLHYLYHNMNNVNNINNIIEK